MSPGIEPGVHNLVSPSDRILRSLSLPQAAKEAHNRNSLILNTPGLALACAGRKNWCSESAYCDRSAMGDYSSSKDQHLELSSYDFGASIQDCAPQNSSPHQYRLWPDCCRTSIQLSTQGGSLSRTAASTGATRLATSSGSLFRFQPHQVHPLGRSIDMRSTCFGAMLILSACRIRSGGRVRRNQWPGESCSWHHRSQRRQLRTADFSKTSDFLAASTAKNPRGACDLAHRSASRPSGCIKILRTADSEQPKVRVPCCRATLSQSGIPTGRLRIGQPATN